MFHAFSFIKNGQAGRIFARMLKRIYFGVRRFEVDFASFSSSLLICICNKEHVVFFNYSETQKFILSWPGKSIYPWVLYNHLKTGFYSTVSNTFPSKQQDRWLVL